MNDELNELREALQAEREAREKAEATLATANYLLGGIQETYASVMSPHVCDAISDYFEALSADKGADNE